MSANAGKSLEDLRADYGFAMSSPAQDEPERTGRETVPIPGYALAGRARPGAPPTH